jgi:hypothetical protein
MTMGTLNRPILMGYAEIVPGRLEPIVMTKFIIEVGQGFIGAAAMIPIGSAQTIRAMLFRTAPAGRQGIL